jgi:TetR/AcrR family transcriptional regulator, regulator of cefoperazone and chloramphenicol sensitivity
VTYISPSENNAEAIDARSRLIRSALHLFAEKGFKAASTREICEAAGVNLSAIRYYFGDKAGLYRAVFNRPIGKTVCHANISSYQELPLAQALNAFFKEFLAPLKKSEEIKLVMKLYYREILEPSECWQQEVDSEIKPQHEALAAVLKSHLHLAEIDADVQRLAFAIIGMAAYFYVGQEVVYAISPSVLNSPAAIDALAERLAGYAVAMIENEARRRTISDQR